MHNRPLESYVGKMLVISLSVIALNFQTAYEQVHQTRSVEAGASHNDAIFTLDHNMCKADSLHVTATWSDVGDESLTFQPTAPYPTPPGVYTLVSNRAFPAQDGITVSFSTLVHCVGGPANPGNYISTPKATVKISPQIPVFQISSEKSEIKTGETARIVIMLTAPAPESNTRVYLEAEPEGVLIIPSYVDVGAGWIRTAFDISAAKDIKEAKNVTLKAKTDGRAQIIRLSVNPP